MVPIDGPVREGVGLLGSPAFEIPRSVERDATFDHYKTEQELARRLAAKNRYNLRTMAVFLLARWVSFAGITLLGLAAAELHADWGVEAAFAVVVGSLVFTTVYGILVERANLTVRSPAPAVLLDLRPLLLVARALLEAARGTPPSSTAPR